MSVNLDHTGTGSITIKAPDSATGKYMKDDGTWGTPTAAVSLDIQDEGGSLTTAPTVINFAGAGVTVTEPSADSILVTIPGSSGGGDGSIGVVYTFESTVGGNPSSGCVRLDNATPSSATLIHISETTKGGVNFDSIIDMLYIDSIIKIADPTAAETKYHLYQVNATFTSGQGSPLYDPIPVAYLTGTGTFTASSDVTISVLPAARRVVARSPMKWEQDFLHASYTSPYTWHIPWTLAAISSGTLAMQAGTVGHPGVYRMTSSTTANSGGYAATTTLTSQLIGGGEESELVFRLQNVSTETLRFGFLDSLTSTQPTDGIWFDIQGATLRGYCKNNAGPTSTASTYTVSNTTWYRAKITVNAAKSSVLFQLYSEAGTLLWSDTVTANIPTAAGRETGHGVVCTSSGTTAAALVDIDYISLVINRNIAR